MNLAPIFDQDNVALAMKIVSELALQGAGDSERSHQGKAEARRAATAHAAFVQDWADDLQAIFESNGGLASLQVDGALPPRDLSAIADLFAQTPLSFVPEALVLAEQRFASHFEPASEFMVEDEAMEIARALDLSCACWLSQGPTLLTWHGAVMPRAYRKPVG